MPREARLDTLGALHHVICRGIERRKIFRDDQDRDNFVERLGNVLSRTSTPCLACRKKGQGSLWQNRYWEDQIRDELDSARHADYTHWNPVKHGHVKYVSDWPYSSFHRHVREGIYPSDWATGTNGDAEDLGNVVEWRV
jgi:REP element-mobilizing transposase RayT